MTTRYDFIDGFDGWSGMGAYTTTGADDSHSPWALVDLTLDLDFDPGATDYSDMVHPTAGVYGGGALRLPQRGRTTMAVRFESAYQLGWYPIEDYTIKGQAVTAAPPYSMTWGYYLKTLVSGSSALNPACGVELFHWTPVSYRANNSGVFIDDTAYAEWACIKRPDDKLWVGWYKTSLSEGTVDEHGIPSAAQQLSGWGDKFYFIGAGGVFISEAQWPNLTDGSNTYDITDALTIVEPGPTLVFFFAFDLCHDFDSKHYVLASNVGGDVRVFEFDLTWTFTGNSWDITADANGCTSIAYLQSEDVFLVGANSTDGRTVAKFDRSFNFVSSSLLSLVSGSVITSLCAMPSSPSQYWVVYTNGTSGRSEVLEPSGTFGTIPTSEAGYPIEGIYDDGFFCWVLGGVAPEPSDGSRGHRFFYRGEMMSNVGFFETGFTGDVGQVIRPPATVFDWGETVFLEHAFRALVTPSASSVGLATTRVDEVKVPVGVADPTSTADFDFASQPYTAGGNVAGLYLTFNETHLRVAGDAAYMDDLYVKVNDTEPTEDPNDYDGPIRIHTVRPTRVSGTLAPVGDFSVFGWKETVSLPQARNDNTSYLVAQATGDSSRIYFGDVPTINGDIGCVVPTISYCREELDLTTSSYPVTEHDVYGQFGITSSLTEGGLVDIPQPDPTNVDLLGKWSASRPYNNHISASCDMYGMMTAFTISETDPLTGVPWSQALINTMKMHIKAAEPDPFEDWPWINRDGA